MSKNIYIATSEQIAELYWEDYIPLSEEEMMKGANNSNVLSGELHPMYGKHHTEETKNLLREAHKGKDTWMKGKQHSEEAKKKMSEARIGSTGFWLNKSRDEETKRKISETKKGIPHKKVKCPHCELEGGIAIMHRFHFDNCKRIS